MTICAATIREKRIIVISDCRVTYKGTAEISDSLVKTYPLTDFSTLSFAGVVDCAKFIITNLNSQHIRDAEKKGQYNVISQTARQIKCLYKKYCKSYVHKAAVSFLLTSCDENCCWIMTCSSPRFDVHKTHANNSAYAIGASHKVRSAVCNSIATSGHSFPHEQEPLVACSFAEGTINLIEEKSDVRRGISGLYTLFTLERKVGIRVITYDTEMFRGRIADRNKSFGYSPTNSVRFDPNSNGFLLVDHQSGKQNKLLDIYSHDSAKKGAINSNFNPYELKG